MLDKGTPCPLGLIRVKTKDLSKLGENHQVLATGYDISNDMLTLFIYDPNYPDLDDVSISFRLAGESLQGTQSTGETLRAFFLISHEGLDSAARASS